MRGLTTGGLRHQVQIQVRGTAVDSFGQQATVWTDVGYTWAQIEPISGREQLAAAMIRSEISHKIAMRARQIFNGLYIAGKYRVVFAGRYFYIKSIINFEERGRWVELDCTEGMNNG